MLPHSSDRRGIIGRPEDRGPDNDGIRARLDRFSGAFTILSAADLDEGGPIVIFGTKRPSITSTWIQSAPPASTAPTSSPRRPKSADKINGATMIDLRCAASLAVLPLNVFHPSLARPHKCP
jgi:hypothetical protein